MDLDEKMKKNNLKGHILKTSAKNIAEYWTFE